MAKNEEKLENDVETMEASQEASESSEVIEGEVIESEVVDP